MPYVNVQITPGASRAQKAELVAAITGALARVLGKKPEHTHVVIQEVAEQNWGYTGLLTDAWRQDLTSSAPARAAARPNPRPRGRSSRRAARRS